MVQKAVEYGSGGGDVAEIAFLKELVERDSSEDIRNRAWRCLVEAREPQLRSFAWQAGYGSFSVSPSEADAVRAYIDEQEDHHIKMSFQDEFRALVRR